jgi:hypothetical protein
MALRERSQRVLSNTLFIRAVIDSVRVTDADIQALYKQCGTEYHLRRMVVPGAERADSIYKLLAAKRIAWSDPYARVSIPQDDAGPDGDIGWVSRFNMIWGAADKIIPLKPGGIASPLRRPHGFEIYSCLGTRPVTDLPALETVRPWITTQVNFKKQFALVDRLQESIRRQIGMTYDDANIAWAAPQFRPALSTTTTKEGAPNLHISAVLPDFKAADTSRVLARYRDGRLTLDRFMVEYANLPLTHRPDVSTPDGFRSQIDAIVLEPYRAQIALERGLDRDPLATEAIEKERERILVEHMYQDSIESKIVVSKEQRQKYYKQHMASFYTYPVARYAQFAYTDTLKAQAMAARLRAGERGDAIIRADSIAGRRPTGVVRTERESDHTAFHEIIFEHLKPGQCEIVGPDANDRTAVIQLLDFDPGHQLTFEQADGYCSDALQAQASEELLKKFIARHKKHCDIESRPQLVMRIKLVSAQSQQ